MKLWCEACEDVHRIKPDRVERILYTLVESKGELSGMCLKWIGVESMSDFGYRRIVADRIDARKRCA